MTIPAADPFDHLPGRRPRRVRPRYPDTAMLTLQGWAPGAPGTDRTAAYAARPRGRHLYLVR